MKGYTRKLKVHCKLRYTKCKDLECFGDRWDLGERRVLQSDPLTWCDRYCEFKSQQDEHDLYGGWKWVQDEKGEWVRE